MTKITQSRETIVRAGWPTAADSASTPEGRKLWLTIGGLAAATFGFSVAGWLLALPMGHASPVWPVAALALAALLVSGARVWPGIWLGAFLFSLWLDPSPEGAAVATVVAAGVTLQALVAAHFTRQLLPGQTRLPSGEIDVTRFLLYAGPLACLVSATFAVAIRYWLGKLAPTEVASQWLIWWAGDSVGVVLFAPLFLLVWPGPRSGRAARTAIRIAPPLVITATLLVGGAVGLTHLEEVQERRDVALSTLEVSDAGFDGLLRTIESLSAVERFFAASEQVTGQEFRIFTAHALRQPGLQAISWAPRITQAERAGFERAARREAAGAFHINERTDDGRLVPARERASYFPSRFVEPPLARTAVLGLDQAADAARHAVLERAGDTATAVATAPQALAATGRPGVLVFMPVYRAGFETAAASVKARRTALRGFVVGAFDIEQLVAPLVHAAQKRQLSVRVSDVTPGQAAQVLVDALPAGASPTRTRETEFAGRLWRLEIKPTVSVWRPGASAQARLYLVFSVLAAFLVAFATLGAAGRNAMIQGQIVAASAALERALRARKQAEALAQRRTEEQLRFQSARLELREQIGSERSDFLQLTARVVAAALRIERAGVWIFDEPRVTLVCETLFTIDQHAASGPQRLDATSFPRFVAALQTEECIAAHTAQTDARTNELTKEYLMPLGITSMLNVPIRVGGTIVGVLCCEHVGPAREWTEGEESFAISVVGTVMLALENHERRRAEEERNRFFDLSLDMLCIADTASHFRRINPAFTQTLGWSTEELLARSFLDFVHPDDMAATLHRVENLEAGKAVNQFLNRYRCKDGSFRWLSWKSAPYPGGLIYATARDVTELQNAQEALRRSEENLTVTLQSIGDAVLATDVHGSVTRMNPVAEQLTGWTAAEAAGRPVDEVFCIINEETRQPAVVPVKEVLATGEIHGLANHTVLIRPDGSERSIADSAAPIRSRDGEILGVVLVFRDVGEERTANQQLDQARLEAEQANRAKSIFLATMSHEIRTPMNGLLGMLELLSLGELDVEQRETLRLARESSKSVLYVLDDILDFSKIEAGRLVIRPEVVSIRQVVEDVRNLYTDAASSKGLWLRHSVDPRISLALQVDALRLRQILNNFVSNAIKFTFEGSIEIKAELISRADGLERLRFAVQDAGIGISAEDQKQLFQPFSQGNSETARHAGGTGLGLAICRRLAEMMGGSVEMVSELGEGTTVVLNLSLPIADPSELRDRVIATAPVSVGRPALTVARAEAEGTLVLLVDDHPTNRMLLMRQVAALGYAAESAEDGLQALDKWKSGRFGIVIADCNMPVMDGYELARRIRTLEPRRGGDRTPIIACTANALAGEAEKCMAAGMDDYLAKPIGLSALHEKLARWLPIAAANGTPPAGRALPEELLPSSSAPLDRALIAATWGDNEDTVREILMEFRRVNDGDARVLRQAVDSADMAQVTHAAHRMLGASKMIGASDFACVCERIQQASRLGDLQAVSAEMRAFRAEWARLNGCIDGLLHS